MTCSLPRDLPQSVPLTVNGVAISRDAVARETQHHPADKPIAAWQAAAQSLVIRELLMQEARRLGIEAEPLADSDRRRETEEEATIRALIEREVRTPEPDSEACRRYYKQNRYRFCSSALFDVAHILFAARQSDADAYERARCEAQMALAAIQRDRRLFAELAVVHSACPSAQQGGALGLIALDETTPEFERAVRSLKVGGISSEPAASRYGFHIIRLDGRIEGRQLSFEAVSERIAAYLAERVRRTASAQYVARLVSRAVISGITLADAQAHNVH